jgi:hypothetical protein
VIVCKECGHQNEDDDLFCGNCPAFLEYSGERIGGPEPMVDEAAPAVQPGLVTRIRHAISGADLPPPAGGGAPPVGAGLRPPGSGAPSMSAPTGAPSGVVPPAPPRTGSERAAALVAKPDALQPPPARATPRTPEAQRPQPTLPRPKIAKQAPSRKINPGDLVCGACGEGNDAQRNYCRRCGSTLAEATVARTRWFRRRPKQAKKSVAAGDRPGRPGRSTSGRNAARGARLARGKFMSRVADLKRVLALLAIVGIGVGLAVPNLRSWAFDNASDGFNKVKRIVSPEYTTIAVDPARITSSGGATLVGETPGGEAVNVADNKTDTFWSAPPEALPASVTVGFAEPTDVEHVLVHPGKQEDGGKVVRPDPRPRELLFRLSLADGTIFEVPATLEDKDGFQKVGLEADDVTGVETVVVNCFPDLLVTVCPITELEFQTKK